MVAVVLGCIEAYSIRDLSAATCVASDMKLDVDVAEAIAARQDLIIAYEAGFHGMILEFDCLKLV
ncbi:hypothetical protein BVRB_4g093820 [Beta vulgaris subsp. vulgaris]|nr:hypothetical protein BVRB_4g093820 [Beta vulgaris subsp. vulgaris]